MSIVEGSSVRAGGNFRACVRMYPGRWSPVTLAFGEGVHDSDSDATVAQWRSALDRHERDVADVLARDALRRTRARYL